MPRLLLSKAAQSDLVGIWVFSFLGWGEAQADRYVDELGDGLRTCGATPDRGKDRGDVRPGYRSLLVRRHVIFYTVTHDQVLVQRVLHGSMDPTLHLLDDGGD